MAPLVMAVRGHAALVRSVAQRPVVLNRNEVVDIKQGMNAPTPLLKDPPLSPSGWTPRYLVSSIL